MTIIATGILIGAAAALALVTFLACLGLVLALASWVAQRL